MLTRPFFCVKNLINSQTLFYERNVLQFKNVQSNNKKKMFAPVIPQKYFNELVSVMAR